MQQSHTQIHIFKQIFSSHPTEKIQKNSPHIQLTKDNTDFRQTCSFRRLGFEDSWVRCVFTVSAAWYFHLMPLTSVLEELEYPSFHSLSLSISLTSRIHADTLARAQTSSHEQVSARTGNISKQTREAAEAAWQARIGSNESKDHHSGKLTKNTPEVDTSDRDGSRVAICDAIWDNSSEDEVHTLVV